MVSVQFSYRLGACIRETSIRLWPIELTDNRTIRFTVIRARTQAADRDSSSLNRITDIGARLRYVAANLDLCSHSHVAAPTSRAACRQNLRSNPFFELSQKILPAAEIRLCGLMREEELARCAAKLKKHIVQSHNINR